MKKRLISVSVGFILLAVLLFFFETLVLNFALCIIGLLATYEISKAYAVPNIPGLLLMPVLMFADVQAVFAHAIFIVLAYLFVLFLIVMFYKKRHIEFKSAAAVFAETVLIGFGIASILLIRERFLLGAFKTDAIIIFIFGLALGWVCDTLAFTVGKLFGKRKMAPHISPNKTVAGGIGGIVGTPIVMVGFMAIYASLSGPESIIKNLILIDYLYFAAVGLVGGFIGMMGDLAASYIKRECDIKDFGKIMPGHGGALDRMDSVLFTIPFTYIAFLIFSNLR